VVKPMLVDQVEVEEVQLQQEVQVILLQWLLLKEIQVVMVQQVVLVVAEHQLQEVLQGQVLQLQEVMVEQDHL
tara:strand:- start:319 stop:537 length:219 start_codon:yes stop_codon:yes gene_type:complete